MNLMGEASIGASKFYLYVNDVKKSETFLLFSPYHRDDRIKIAMGESPTHPVIQSVTALSSVLKKEYRVNYLIEGMWRSKVSGKIKSYRNATMLETVLSTISFARNYQFATNNIKVDQQTAYFDEIQRIFNASDSNLSYQYTNVNQLNTFLKVTYGTTSISLEPSDFNYSLKDLDFIEVNTSDRKRLSVYSLKTVTYNMLREKLDLSWYEDETGLKKVYQAIETIKDFEEKIMRPLALKLKECVENNTTLDIAVDTETTGFNIYNLSKDNEDRDHCVAIPICWEHNKSFVIFTDMENFDNIPIDYVVNRLAVLFERFEGTRELEYWDTNSTENNNAPISMNLFLNNGELSAPTYNTSSTSNKIIFRRLNVNLIGHNILYDGKVFYMYGKKFYFDNDTLQMAFDLNPKVIKNSVKLKNLTRKIFGHETPELTDTLGKGNEDKYRNLADKLVAIIYGCADSDYTLQLFHYLKSIMPEKMFYYYQRQDMRMLNILYISEYNGMMTIEEEVTKLAEQTKQNIEILKNVIYQYTGTFVDYSNKRSVIESQYKAGVISESEYLQAISNIKVKEDATYEFDFKATQIRTVLYDILHYPIYAYTDGKKKLPKTDKFVMQKLASKKKEKGAATRGLKQHIFVYGKSQRDYEKLISEGKEKAAKALILVDCNEFNSAKFPVALVLQKYAELFKEYTSYYKPLRDTNMEGKIFRNYSLARIETRRIMNPSQTMKGNLKAFIRAYSDDYYLLDFDMSQVEYRIMLSLAKFSVMIRKMSDPEMDYHVETASLVNNIPAHKVSKKLRKNTKGVSFGVPYGLGERKLCERLFGEINEDNLVATRDLLHRWQVSNKPIMDMLNEERDKALDPAIADKFLTDELRTFMGLWEENEDGTLKLDDNGKRVPIPTGMSFNEYGFYRTYDLRNLDKKRISSIRNAAGNFPIQCFAAEMFRIILIRFYDRCVKEGIEDKVLWHMLIHDELLCSVHKSIHPFFIYKIVKEACMVTMKGHTKYFVGINIGDTWAETKDDAREAPVLFVNRIVQRWDAGEFKNDPEWFDHPWEYIKPYRQQYVEDRIGEVIADMYSKVGRDISSEPLDIPFLLNNFQNYTVRAYVNDYSPNFKLPADAISDEDWASRLETWALKVFGEGKSIIDINGRYKLLSDRSNEVEVSSADTFIDYAELFEDDTYDKDNYWSFDEEEVEDIYSSTTYIYDEDEFDEFALDYDLDTTGATSVAQMIVRKAKYKYVSVINNQIVIKVNSVRQLNAVKKFIAPYQAREGKSILFKDITGHTTRWIRVNDSLDIDKLESMLASE